MPETKQPKGTASPAIQYLALVRERIAAIRQDLPKLIAMGERMAELLLDGGNIFPPPVGPVWVSEFSGRAGGLMGLKAPGYQPDSTKDVAYFDLPDARSWDPSKDKVLRALMKGKAQLFVIGREEDLCALGSLDRFAGFTGGAAPDAGLYAFDPFRPFAPVRPFDKLVRGWLVAGEMIAACIRGGRMPIIYMSVWLEGANVRNAYFIKHDNTDEPWSVPLFHEGRYIPPLEPGRVSNEFLSVAENILRTLESQQTLLAKAGDWMAETKRAGKRIWTILVGHSYPMILELPGSPAYPLDWGASNSNLSTAVPPRYGEGDVALHLGYSPVNVARVQRILDRGLRFIYSSPYGRPATLPDHERLLWLDLPWRPTDATVDVPGYSVRILPMSSTAHTMAYFAMLCEMAERMGWK